jgi:hypothetical protein
VHVPLETKTPGIVLLIHETDYSIDLRVLPATASADQIAAPTFEGTLASKAAEHRQHFVSDSRPVVP